MLKIKLLGMFFASPDFNEDIYTFADETKQALKQKYRLEIQYFFQTKGNTIFLSEWVSI